jgi:hypothetical protein
MAKRKAQDSHLDDESPRKYKHNDEERAAMAEAKQKQRAAQRIPKLIQKLVQALHSTPDTLESFLIAYQHEGLPIRSTSSSNLYRFVQLSGGINQVFMDASSSQEDARTLKYQCVSDAFELLDRDELAELAKELGHNHRLQHYRREFELPEEPEGSEESAEQHARQNTQAQDSLESTEDTLQMQQVSSDSEGERATQRPEPAASKPTSSPHEAYSQRFQAMTQEEKQSILTTPTSRLNRFKLQASTMMSLEIHDKGTVQYDELPLHLAHTMTHHDPCSARRCPAYACPLLVCAYTYAF